MVVYDDATKMIIIWCHYAISRFYIRNRRTSYISETTDGRTIIRESTDDGTSNRADKSAQERKHATKAEKP